MPVQATIAITPGSGQFLDAVSLVIGGNTVVRETMVIADPTAATQLAGVTVGGALQVDASATTQPITGILTPNNAAPDAHNIGVLPAIANVAAPTYAEGKQVLLSTDLTGALRVNVGSVVASNNITEWDSVALGAPSAYGTGPGAVNVIGVNAFVTNFPVSQVVTLVSTTITGSVAVTSDGTFEVVQDTAADFNATVVGTGTFVVQATLAAETTKVIGTVNIAASQTIAVTQATGTNLHAVIDSGSTTAVTGNVTVVQATGTNLHAVIDSGSTTVVTGVVEVAPTGSANTKTNPFFTEITDGTNVMGTMAVFGTAPSTSLAGLSVNAAAFLPAGSAAADAFTNVGVVGILSTSNGSYVPQVGPLLFNGTTWDRQRTATIGNAVAATGIAATTSYGEYLTTAPAPTTGQYSALQTDNAGSLFVKNTRRSQTAAQGTTITTSTAATAVTATPAANTFADLSQLVITITPIAVTAIALTATLSDGTNTYIYDLDSGVVATGGGTAVSINFNPPLPATSAATGWTVALSVNTVVAHVTTIVVLQKAS